MLAKLKVAGRFILRHWFLALVVICAVLIIMAANVFESRFVYFPSKVMDMDPSQIGLEYEDVRAVTADGVKLHGWFIPNPGAHYTFLIFHGNGGNICNRLGWIPVLRDLGAHVMLIDYRGYGRSEGEPFEKGLYLDARAAYAWWAQTRAGDRSKLILIGESLGGAVAVDLAAEVPVDGLVLQSTFTDAWDMAKTMFPIGLLQPFTGVRFDSAAKIRNITCPKLFIHGDRDDVVPLRLGQKLYDLAPSPKSFCIISGAGHNDLLWIAGPEYTQQLRAFLSRL